VLYAEKQQHGSEQMNVRPSDVASLVARRAVCNQLLEMSEQQSLGLAVPSTLRWLISTIQAVTTETMGVSPIELDYFFPPPFGLYHIPFIPHLHYATMRTSASN